MAVQTGGQIGAVEMIVATAVCGVLFALVSGQPLILLGGTGPLLVFTALFYQLCQNIDIPFLPAYTWVGLWTAGLLLALAATDASCLMRYFTRFTDETFAALISMIFIYEAIKALTLVFRDLDVKQHHDTALLTLLLALGTVYIATNLSTFRKSRYLLPQVRELLADFGPAIALITMTVVAVLLGEVYLDVLPVPDQFQTTSGRPWLVDPWAVPAWIGLPHLPGDARDRLDFYQPEHYFATCGFAAAQTAKTAGVSLESGGAGAAGRGLLFVRTALARRSNRAVVKSCAQPGDRRGCCGPIWRAT